MNELLSEKLTWPWVMNDALILDKEELFFIFKKRDFISFHYTSLQDFISIQSRKNHEEMSLSFCS